MTFDFETFIPALCICGISCALVGFVALIIWSMIEENHWWVAGVVAVVLFIPAVCSIRFTTGDEGIGHTHVCEVCGLELEMEAAADD